MNRIKEFLIDASLFLIMLGLAFLITELRA